MVERLPTNMAGSESIGRSDSCGWGVPRGRYHLEILMHASGFVSL